MDIFGNNESASEVHVNIYADEAQDIKCPYTRDLWHYISIIVEDVEHPVLPDIIERRFCGNYENKSPYYEKNNKIVHWSELRTADTKNICKRWFEYILNPSESINKFHSYILGINSSKLDSSKFSDEDIFNCQYNRFFRSAVEYSLKCFFSGRQVVVDNIYHEEGQQQNNQYFSWHTMYKLIFDSKISFNCNEIEFLPKDHKIDKRSNIIQLCDVVLGATMSVLSGLGNSKKKYKEELLKLYSPLVKRIIEFPGNINSRYKYHNRIMIKFFPEKKVCTDDFIKVGKFYHKRKMKYFQDLSPQLSIF